jgi:hypothetical protein
MLRAAAADRSRPAPVVTYNNLSIRQIGPDRIDSALRVAFSPSFLRLLLWSKSL